MMMTNAMLLEQIGALLRMYLPTSETKMLEVPDLFPSYESRPQHLWRSDEIFRWGVNQYGETQLWRVLEAVPEGNEHFTPDQLPRYFRRVGFTDSGIPIWSQPLGYDDAWDIGDTVEHPAGSGELWVVEQGNASGPHGMRNTFEPGVWGWIRLEVM